MKKKLFSLPIILISCWITAQVGINTETPKATLDIVGSATDVSKADGMIAPRLTGAQLSAKDNLYNVDQEGAIVYATSASPDSGIGGKTINVDAEGYYYFDGTLWVKFSSGSTALTADNGLTKVEENIQLGGTLLKDTDVATDGYDMTYSGTGKVGIGTDTPTNKLDINGNLRVRDIPMSTTTEDISLVADEFGVVKKRVNETTGIMRAYLSSNFAAGSDAGLIYKILNWNVIDNPGNNFDPTTGLFTASETGLYKITITATSSPTTAEDPSGNYVLGFANNDDGKWIMRFSIPDDYVKFGGVGSTAGTANTFVGVVQLTAGKKYYFGASRDLKLLSHPSGTSGTGIGSFFEVQLIKN